MIKKFKNFDKIYESHELVGNDLLMELIEDFKVYFLSLGDSIEILFDYCYYGDNSVDKGRRIQFDYEFKDLKGLPRRSEYTGKILKRQPYALKAEQKVEMFNGLVDSSRKIRLIFRGRFNLLPKSNLAYRDGNIGGYRENGNKILNIDKVFGLFGLLGIEIPEIIGRLRDQFERVEVSLSAIGNELEIIAFCDAEITKKVGLLDSVLSSYESRVDFKLHSN